jgi:hypothetical protein
LFLCYGEAGINEKYYGKVAHTYCDLNHKFWYDACVFKYGEETPEKPIGTDIEFEKIEEFLC